MKKDNRVERLADLIHPEKQAKEGRYYHNAKSLVEIYAKVMWGLENSYLEYDETCAQFGYEGINEALDFLSLGISEDLSGLGVEDRARSMVFTRELIKLVDRSMLALKDYPKYGEEYFEIIQDMYLLKYRYSEDEIIEKLDVSRSTFYRKKKEALSMLGVVLWGFMLPKMMSEKNETEMRPA
ncbi:MAG: hypothetical protein Q4B42_03995 [Oscillospiraceae bacterium]|nr:hypothetical protein [Oscillospiraceae bacterium]